MAPVQTRTSAAAAKRGKQAAIDIMTSSLTTLETISTPDSYYTAKGSPPDDDDDHAADTTAISTPPAVNEEEEQDPAQKLPRYRTARPIPHELKQSCQIHLEEELYSAAILLFNGFLGDGNDNLSSSPRYCTQATAKPPPPPPASSSSSAAAAVRVPPPSQLGLLGTLMIHPSYTSRAPEQSNLHVASQSLAYLRGLVSLVGPVNANLRTAFAFTGSERGGGGARRGGARPSPDSTNDDDSDSDAMETRYAKEQSIWKRAPDFWAVLGWAFRCAAQYPHRWVYWKSWLEFMVTVLEDDWDERRMLIEEKHDRRVRQGASPAGSEAEYGRLRESLLASYMGDLQRERKQPLKEVMRALMAFTDVDSSSDAVFYKEVFVGETATGPRKNKRKRTPTVDLEKNQFGDYLDGLNEDDFGSSDDETTKPPPTPTKAAASRTSTRRSRRGVPSSSKRQQQQPAPPQAKREEKAPQQPEFFRLTEGIAESIPLRLRLFRLLSAFSFHLPPQSFTEVSEFYETVADRIRLLPLPAFKLFVSSHSTPLPEFAHVSLLRHIVDTLLSPPSHSGRPDPQDVDADADEINGISTEMLERCFLPFASQRVTPEDNAKLSVALESMLWCIYANVERRGGAAGAGGMEYSEGLRRAVERGIRAREEKSRPRKGGGGGGNGEDKAAREALERSARNLRLFVEVLKPE